jgi:hypothetical protein
MASPTPAQPTGGDGPVLFFDRDVGKTIPQALRYIGLPTHVEFHQEHFAHEADDDEWMASVGPKGWFVIGHDRHHHTRAPELAAIRQHGIGCFYLWGGDKLRYETLRCFLNAYPNIRQAMATTERPFVYRIEKSGNLTPIELPVPCPCS